ncbi:MAG: 2-C-methyl-D-erythritol 2,4-cyclodiphosphate synthase [Bacteroidia bacterium]|nr:2-C-methyl-D-erythritol 2,4-cyclodiphosphate synthase [Bacteroidia bacterium]
MSYRIGSGVDFHKLSEGRELWIGGIKIAHHKGAVGHSDADVLLHAICDALLGALSLGDIGEHFPDTDDAYKNIDSKILLQKTVELVKTQGYTVVNLDTTVCLELPKIRPYVGQMQKIIANILNVSEKDVSIKATTTEQMGFAGREEGLMAYATVLLEKVDKFTSGHSNL